MATCLFDADIDEQLIKLKTGYSSDAARSYKHASETKLTKITDVMAAKWASNAADSMSMCVWMKITVAAVQFVRKAAIFHLQIVPSPVQFMSSFRSKIDLRGY